MNKIAPLVFGTILLTLLAPTVAGQLMHEVTVGIFASVDVEGSVLNIRRNGTLRSFTIDDDTKFYSSNCDSIEFEDFADSVSSGDSLVAIGQVEMPRSGRPGPDAPRLAVYVHFGTRPPLRVDQRGQSPRYNCPPG